LQRKRCTTRIYHIVPHPRDAPGTTQAWAEASEFADAPAANAAFAAPGRVREEKKTLRDAKGRSAERKQTAQRAVELAAQTCC